MKTLKEYKAKFGKLAGEKNYYLDKAFEAQTKLDATKKPATKKSTVKKPAVKKAAIKKPATKKPAVKKVRNCKTKKR